MWYCIHVYALGMRMREGVPRSSHFACCALHCGRRDPLVGVVCGRATATRRCGAASASNVLLQHHVSGQ